MPAASRKARHASAPECPTSTGTEPKPNSANPVLTLTLPVDLLPSSGRIASGPRRVKIRRSRRSPSLRNVRMAPDVPVPAQWAAGLAAQAANETEAGFRRLAPSGGARPLWGRAAASLGCRPLQARRHRHWTPAARSASPPLPAWSWYPSAGTWRWFRSRSGPAVPARCECPRLVG